MNFLKISNNLYICFIVLIFLIFIMRKPEQFNNKNEAAINFLKDPLNNPFCPHMPTLKSNRFFDVPGQTGVSMKFCCSGCFKSVVSELNKKNGVYKVEVFKETDIELLRGFHNRENLDINFPEKPLRDSLGKKVLKKNNLAVQILKEN